MRRDKGTLNGMCRNRPHQGLVLRASALEYKPMQALPDPTVAAVDGQPPLWLALDEVTDPQNMGALLRSAFFLGRMASWSLEELVLAYADGLEGRARRDGADAKCTRRATAADA